MEINTDRPDERNDGNNYRDIERQTNGHAEIITARHIDKQTDKQKKYRTQIDTQTSTIRETIWGDTQTQTTRITNRSTEWKSLLTDVQTIGLMERTKDG